MTKKNLLKGLTLPETITYEVEKEEGKYSGHATVVAYPFERGFGTTIANSLRRCLLSSIQGYAVSSILINYKKDGKANVVSNEFESIPGVKEDVLEIIANIKHLALRVDGEGFQSTTFTIEAKGPGTIKGEAFAKNGITVINSDLHILTMEKDVSLDIEVQVDFGRGYIPGDLQKKYVEQYGVIGIDSLFSPIVRVNSNIENARVGQRNDYEKIVLDVWTNGTTSAVQAISEAAFILTEYLTKFIGFDKNDVLKKEEVDELDKDKQKLLKSPVDSLDLSSRCLNCLKRVQINFIYELVSKTEKDLKNERNFGDKSLEEIKEKLSNIGLCLGMTDIEV